MWYRCGGRYCHGQVSGKNSAEAGAPVLPRFSSGRTTRWGPVRCLGRLLFGAWLAGRTRAYFISKRRLRRSKLSWPSLDELDDFSVMARRIEAVVARVERERAACE